MSGATPSHRPFFRRQTASAIAGSTLVEAMLACGIVAVFLAGLYDMNWRSLFVLKSGIDTTSATELTTNIAEQIRTATWQQITDPTYLSGTILANSTATGHLPNAVQKIDVNPYPVPSSYGSPLLGSETVEVQRNASGNVTTAYAGNGKLPSETAVQIDITVSWNGTFKSTPHTRVLRLITSQGGVLGQN